MTVTEEMKEGLTDEVASRLLGKVASLIDSEFLGQTKVDQKVKDITGVLEAMDVDLESDEARAAASDAVKEVLTESTVREFVYTMKALEAGIVMQSGVAQGREFIVLYASRKDVVTKFREVLHPMVCQVGDEIAASGQGSILKRTEEYSDAEEAVARC